MEDFSFTQADWEKGLSILELIEGMAVNQEAMLRRYHSIELKEDEIIRLKRLVTPMRMLVLTEDWCSDCLMNLPILARIVEAAPGLEIRFFNRKDWPELRAYFNNRDIYSLPAVQILDDRLQPLAVWVERSQAAHQRLAAWKEAHPEVELTRRRADLTSEQKREMLKKISDRLLVEMEGWYAQSLQSETVNEIAGMLESFEKGVRVV